MARIEAYLGVDLGGTGAKAGVFDRRGKMLGFGHRSYAPIQSRNGHIEIPIGEIYEAARHAAVEALGSGNFRVRAMAVSSQGQTFVSLDDKDRPLHNAIIWYDSRAAAQADAIRKKTERAARPLPFIEAIATGPKILWLKQNLPGVMKKARRHLLLPDYMAYRLTGRAVTDQSTGTSTGFLSEGTLEYHEAVLKAVGVTKSQLAEVQPPGSAVGTILPAMAKSWKLDADTLLVAGTNDQYAGALGAGNCRPGILSETTGTCLALVTLTKKLPRRMPAGLLGGAFPIDEYSFALAYCKTAGVVLDWFRREFCPHLSLKELDALAAKVPIGAHGITMIPHFDGTVSPEPDLAVRGVFSNLTLQHTAADMYRSILESLTFSLLENVEFLGKCGMKIGTVRSIGGGAKNDFWLQMKADVLGMPVEKPKVTEAAVMGAAMLAAVGCGDFKSLAESSKTLYRKDRVFAPNRKSSREYEAPYARYLALRKKR